MDPWTPDETFRGLVLRHRGRTGLTQRDLAARLGVDRRTLQDWEAGLKYPSAERLQALIQALLAASGLSVGHEHEEAEALWAAVLRDAPRMHPPFDKAWFAAVLASHAPTSVPTTADVIRTVPVAEPNALERNEDWGEAPDVLGFIGRAEELAALRSWILGEGCRLLAVLGMGGIGKTALAAKLVQEVVPTFQRLYWRSLRDALPTSDWLAGAIGFLSDQQLVPPAGEAQQLASVLQLLRERRSLLVLDNFETVFEPGQRESRYRDGYDGYGRLLRAIGEGRHQSCLLLTSREAPQQMTVLTGAVARRIELGGLGVADAQALLAEKPLAGDERAWAELIARFGGNSLALKVVGETIGELFGGDISTFLAEAGPGGVFGGIRRLVRDQVERSSTLEQQVLRVLAIAREPITLPELLGAFDPGFGRGAVMEAVEGLRRRSLIERADRASRAGFMLQSVLLEYVTDRLTADVVDEIQSGRPVLLVQQALIQAQAKDYVRQTQERLIGAPILQQLQAHYGRRGTDERLLALLENWRTRASEEHGFGLGPGNVVNLLRLLRGSLRGLDLSRLAIRQAYFAEVDAQDASLAGAHLAETVLADAFYFPSSVALSADGSLLAAGTSTGQVWLWRVADRTLLLAVQGHTGTVWGVALSADGELLASGGLEGTVRLWETGSGRPLATLPGHAGGVWGVALSADGELLASGGMEGTVRLWETGSGRPLATLQGHTGGVWGVALSADGELLAMGTGRCGCGKPAAGGRWSR